MKPTILCRVCHTMDVLQPLSGFMSYIHSFSRCRLIALSSNTFRRGYWSVKSFHFEPFSIVIPVIIQVMKIQLKRSPVGFRGEKQKKTNLPFLSILSSVTSFATLFSLPWICRWTNMCEVWGWICRLASISLTGAWAWRNGYLPQGKEWMLWSNSTLIRTVIKIKMEPVI